MTLYHFNQLPPMLASLPMYLVTPLAVNQLWDWLKQDLIQQLGNSYQQLALGDLMSPDNLHTHWQEPSLLVSQTCGYPLMTELNKKVNLLLIKTYYHEYYSFFI